MDRAAPPALVALEEPAGRRLRGHGRTGEAVCDLDYEEDHKAADVDMNLVMTGGGPVRRGPGSRGGCGLRSIQTLDSHARARGALGIEPRSSPPRAAALGIEWSSPPWRWSSRARATRRRHAELSELLARRSGRATCSSPRTWAGSPEVEEDGGELRRERRQEGPWPAAKPRPGGGPWRTIPASRSTALGGAPGIRSARYSPARGPPTRTTTRSFSRELEGDRPPADRSGPLRRAPWPWPAPDGEVSPPWSTDRVSRAGSSRRPAAREVSGTTRLFLFDRGPIPRSPPASTFAELSTPRKRDAVSHRGRALRAARPEACPRLLQHAT